MGRGNFEGGFIARRRLARCQKMKPKTKYHHMVEPHAIHVATGVSRMLQLFVFELDVILIRSHDEI